MLERCWQVTQLGVARKAQTEGVREREREGTMQGRGEGKGGEET